MVTNLFTIIDKISADITDGSIKLVYYDAEDNRIVMNKEGEVISSLAGAINDVSGLTGQIGTGFTENSGISNLGTDGGEGTNPVYGPARIKVPIYPIALGDSTVRKDLLIARVNHNKIAFLGNSFPLEIIIDAKQAAGSRSNLTIEEDSIVVYNRAIEISGSNFHATVPAILDAKSKGIHHYKVKLSSIEGEVTLINNQYDLFVEVVEQKQKVLVLFAAPHPDLAVLLQTLESNLNY